MAVGTPTFPAGKIATFGGHVCAFTLFFSLCATTYVDVIGNFFLVPSPFSHPLLYFVPRFYHLLKIVLQIQVVPVFSSKLFCTFKFFPFFIPSAVFHLPNQNRQTLHCQKSHNVSTFKHMCFCPYFHLQHNLFTLFHPASTAHNSTYIITVGRILAEIIIHRTCNGSCHILIRIKWKITLQIATTTPVRFVKSRSTLFQRHEHIITCAVVIWRMLI